MVYFLHELVFRHCNGTLGSLSTKSWKSSRKMLFYIARTFHEPNAYHYHHHRLSMGTLCHIYIFEGSKNEKWIFFPREWWFDYPSFSIHQITDRQEPRFPLLLETLLVLSSSPSWYAGTSNSISSLAHNGQDSFERENIGKNITIGHFDCF